jgi:large conductance mechanosensitive channel
MLSDFRAFLTKSNALALAIGVIIGTALGGVVTSLVDDIIMPPIGLVLGGVDFADLKMVLQRGDGVDPATEVAIRWGSFVSALITFVVIAFVVYWIGKTLIREAPAEAAPATQTCPYCKEEVAGTATKCRYCGSTLSPA